MVKKKGKFVNPVECADSTAECLRVFPECIHREIHEENDMCSVKCSFLRKKSCVHKKSACNSIRTWKIKKEEMTPARKKLIEISEYFKEMHGYDPVFIGSGEEAEAYLPAIVGETEFITKDGDGCSSEVRICYDEEKLLECMMAYNKESYEEAREWYDFNTVRALPYVEHPPVIMRSAPWNQ